MVLDPSPYYHPKSEICYTMVNLIFGFVDKHIAPGFARVC